MRLTDRTRPWAAAALVFLLTGALAGSAIRQSERTREQLERARVADLALVRAHAIEEQIGQALSATYALAALIRQGNGDLGDFDATARELLPYYSGATSLRLAPGGVVRQIYPLAGNEGALGLDLLHDADRAVEARQALETGRLTIAGPHRLASGGFGAVGRLPVFLGERRVFWGFVIVSLRMPDALGAGRLAELSARGLVYRLWRIHPATGARQTIDASARGAPIEPVNQAVRLPNAAWTLSVAPIGGWGDAQGLAFKLALGLGFALLLAGLAKLLIEARVQRRGLAALVAERTAQLVAREADLHRAQAVAQVGSWTLDLHSRRFSWSAETGRILGLPDGPQIPIRSLLSRVERADRLALIRARRAVLRGEGHDIEYRLKVGDAQRWVRERAELVYGTDGRPMRCLGTLQDITERKQAEEEIRQLAFYDPLTALANRRLLIDRLQQALARSARTGRLGALLFLDLDDFKSFNDLLGHDAGDSLLKQVAGRLAAAVRRQDSVARLGGDEFVIMVEDLGTDPASAAAHAQHVAERAMGALLAPCRLGEQEHAVGASIGIALFGERQESVEAVLKRADEAMYRAKAGGGGTLSPPQPIERGWTRPERLGRRRGARKQALAQGHGDGQGCGTAPGPGVQPLRDDRVRKKSR